MTVRTFLTELANYLAALTTTISNSTLHQGEVCDQWNISSITHSTVFPFAHTEGMSVYSADVDSRCLSSRLGCQWLAAVLFDTCAAAALVVFSAWLHLLFVNKLNRVKFITKICIALTALG